MKKLLLVFVQVINILFICATKDVPCRYFPVRSDFFDGMSRKTCDMTKATEIYSEEVFISSKADSLVRGITFEDNKQILFLPSRVDLKFPNLELYSAANCSIEKISKRNFKNLQHLTHLWLFNNQIEYIPSDTFEDLIAIQVISLYDNKIKALNGETFKGLSKLTTVNLQKNKCIDEWFGTSTMSNLVEKVDKSCKKFCESSNTINEHFFCEVSKQIKETSETTADAMSKLSVKLDENLRQASRIATLEAQLTSQARTISQRNSILANREKEISQITVKVARLETSLTAAEQAKTLFQNQLTELRKVYGKLENSWNATCTERNKEISSLLEMKMIEIDQLLNDKDRMSSDLQKSKSLVAYYKTKSNDLCEDDSGDKKS